MQDVAERLANRVQLTADGHRAYLQAVEGVFGNDIDFAQLVKLYGGADTHNANERRYSPAICTGAKKIPVTGNPDQAHISTSHVERQNLNHADEHAQVHTPDQRLFQKVENHGYAIALHFVHYNFCRIHKTLRVTPAMEAGLTTDIMSIEEIVKLANPNSK